MSDAKTVLPCEFSYPDGKSCGDPSVAHCMCARHYAQDRRGRLGKTKEIASPGENVKPTVSVTMRPDLLVLLDSAAAKRKLSRSETLDLILCDFFGI